MAYNPYRKEIGIDTPSERAYFEYRPVLKLRKKPIRVDPNAPEYIQPIIVEESTVVGQYSYIDALKEIIDLESKIDKLIAIADEQLALRVVKIDPSESHVSEAVKLLNSLNGDVVANDDEISFKMYKYSLTDNSVNNLLVRSVFEEAESGIGGSFAGEVYHILHIMKNNISSFKDLLFDISPIDSRNIDELENWYKKNEDYHDELYSEYRYLNSKEDVSDDERNRIFEIDREIREREYAAITRNNFGFVAHKYTIGINNLFDQIKLGLLSTTADSFDGVLPDILKSVFSKAFSREFGSVIDDIVMNNVNSNNVMDREVQQRINNVFSELDKTISNIKLVLLYLMNSKVKETNFIDSKIGSIMGQSFKSIQNKLIGVVQRLRSYIIAPIINWLDDIVTTDDQSVFDKFGNKIMDFIDKIEDDYLLNLTDLFRVNNFGITLLEQRFSAANEKKYIRDFYNVLDRLQLNLGSAKSWSISGQLDKWIGEFIRNNGLDTHYDQETGSIQRIEI